MLLQFQRRYLYLSPSLPSVEALRNVSCRSPSGPTARDGKLISEFGEMRRTPIPLADIPPGLHPMPCCPPRDDNFANHYGVDVKA